MKNKEATSGLMVGVILIYATILYAISPLVHQPDLDGTMESCANPTHSHLFGDKNKDLSAVVGIARQDRESIKEAAAWMSIVHGRTAWHWERVIRYNLKGDKQ